MSPKQCPRKTHFNTHPPQAHFQQFTIMSSVPRPRYKRITYFCAHVFSVPSQYVVGLSKVRHYQLGIVEAVKEPTFAGKSARRKDTRISSFDTLCFDRFFLARICQNKAARSRSSWVEGSNTIRNGPQMNPIKVSLDRCLILYISKKKCFCLWLVIGCLRGITTLRFQTNE